MKKIVVYSHDGYGLGNVRRMLEISDHLVARDPEVGVLLISGSSMVHAFRLGPRIDYVKLPCIGRNETGDTVVKTLRISSCDTIRLRSDIITSAVTAFEPDLMLVDKKPFGLYDELGRALTVMHRQGRRPAMALLLRDILDARAHTIREWTEHRYHEAIRVFYDRVLIVGTPEVFDASREYAFPPSTAAKVRYCGYIRRHAPARDARTVRAELGIGDEPMVLVTAGGGADGFAMMRACLAGLAGRTSGPALRTLVISGPEMPAPERDELARLAGRCHGVTLRTFTDDMVGCMNAADVVVSMGGYNTICELLTLGKSAVIVPRAHPVQEQWIRAERMQAMGLLRAIHPDVLTPHMLVQAVDEALAARDGRGRAIARFPMDGLAGIADGLDAMFGSSRCVSRQFETRPSLLPGLGAPRLAAALPV
jgi:predicted glycosyltransferase